LLCEPVVIVTFPVCPSRTVELAVGRETATSYCTTLLLTELCLATDVTLPPRVLFDAGKTTDADCPTWTFTMSASATAAFTCLAWSSTRVTMAPLELLAPDPELLPDVPPLAPLEPLPLELLLDELAAVACPTTAPMSATVPSTGARTMVSLTAFSALSTAPWALSIWAWAESIDPCRAGCWFEVR